MLHYNIAKKTQVNPFENVKYITIASNISNGASTLEEFLHKKASEVDVKKIENRFIFCFDIKLLDFTTIVKWFGPNRGTFQIKNSSVHFKINEDFMNCW